MTETSAATRYPQPKQPAYPAWEQEILDYWSQARVFEASVAQRQGQPTFTFYEGPPSANGAPGIHHVMARTIKDLFCRYKTLKGYQVHRKAGWDTHGLPIELSVEKTLGITKKDIGTKITVEEYNAACRREVMKYKEQWDRLTQEMGYWVDLNDPYITFENDYIESVWHLLKRLYDKQLLYKGYTIQPYSPAAGTGLSSHELNQPGCYRMVKDTSCVAMFELKGPTPEGGTLHTSPLPEGGVGGGPSQPNTFLLAWTTTPWTLPANAALAVGANITYALVETFNAYTQAPILVWLAQDRLGAYFAPESQTTESPTLPAADAWPKNPNHLPWRVVRTALGKDLVGMRYAQLMPYAETTLVGAHAENAFTVIAGDFVTTEDGTGIVHIAPTFGADDKRVAELNSVPSVMAKQTSATAKNGSLENNIAPSTAIPVVDKEGKYCDIYRAPYFGISPNAIAYLSSADTHTGPTPNPSPLGEGDTPLLWRGVGGEAKARWQTANPEKWQFLKAKAKEMRHVPTEAEARIWELVRDRRLGGYKFRRQHAIGDFIVDFVCLEKMLVLEIDGAYHEQDEAAYIDAARAQELISLGYQVVRLPNALTGDLDNLRTPLLTLLQKEIPCSLNLNGRYVKNYTDDPNYQNLDVDICVHLKQRNRAFRVEKYEHNYPHCWRTDKPVLYYPLDSWFVATSKAKDKLVAKNKEINWKPESTGTGRFGHWLENLVDWNLSRSRFWGIPLPFWVNEARTDQLCIGSIAELQDALEHAVVQGVAVEANQAFLAQIKASHSNKKDTTGGLDLHRPYIDTIVLADSEGRPMYREPDLIDVWFDSGAMPFAQWHYPFANQETFRQNYPADFIAEGVDQTRGWFFTLHAISVLLEDSIAYKNVIANGLVLDKDGNKMSKRLGNAVDPFAMIGKYGADSVRWYMVETNPPWENLRFNEAQLEETQRKFFGTLLNTYNFFALYANIDDWQRQLDEPLPPVNALSELDRWILSCLHSLIQETDTQYADYEPTRAARAIQHFVTEQLSNWYVRLSRRRFWKGELNADKAAAYATLHHCLVTVAQLMCPIAPFFADWLFRALLPGQTSVHLSQWPTYEPSRVDTQLEARMQWAQALSSLGHAIRKKAKIKARQPLAKALVPVLNDQQRQHIAAVAELVQAELNIKALEVIDASSGQITRKVKPDFKRLGPRLGPQMKLLAPAVAQLSQADILALEATGAVTLMLEGTPFVLQRDEVEILSEDVPGWSVASEKGVTVALDITLTEALKQEGIARDLINRIQNLRKSRGLEVTDRIRVSLQVQAEWQAAAEAYKSYICAETLADAISYESADDAVEIEIDGTTGTLNIVLS